MLIFKTYNNHTANIILFEKQKNYYLKMKIIYKVLIFN